MTWNFSYVDILIHIGVAMYYYVSLKSDSLLRHAKFCVPNMGKKVLFSKR